MGIWNRRCSEIPELDCLTWGKFRFTYDAGTTIGCGLFSSIAKCIRCPWWTTQLEIDSILGFRSPSTSFSKASSERTSDGAVPSSLSACRSSRFSSDSSEASISSQSLVAGDPNAANVSSVTGFFDSILPRRSSALSYGEIEITWSWFWTPMGHCSFPKKGSIRQLSHHITRFDRWRITKPERKVSPFCAWDVMHTQLCRKIKCHWWVSLAL